MKAIVALNGSVTSEASAVYAIRYCRLYGYDLELLHIKNRDDPIEDVESSMTNIETLSLGAEVECNRVILKGKGIAPLVAYARNNRVAIIFCTTKAMKGYFKRSFSDYLTRVPLPCDIAVVRIADLAAVSGIRHIGLGISNAKLSVEKFTFFASMVHAFEAESELYSIATHSVSARADISFEEMKGRLEQINHRLIHYRHLAQLQQMKLPIKHAIAGSEVEQLLHHAVHAGYDLLIVGGKRLSFFSFFTASTPLESLLQHTSINLIAFYPKAADHD